MKKNIDFYFTQRIIDLLMKIAGVVVTSVATLEVAQSAFAHVPDPWLLFIKIGALILVEGAFIASWLAIDTQHSAPMPMKAAWAITLVVIYLALLIIALEHGEGAAGWAFRFVLAVMIGRSIYEAGVYEWLRNNKKTERNARSSHAVRRVHRKLAKRDAIRALNMESTQANYARELGNEVARAKIEAEHEAALIDVKLMRERLLSGVQAKDTIARKRLQEQILKENHTPRSLRESTVNGHTPLPTNGHAASNGAGMPSSQAGANKKDRIKDQLLGSLVERPNMSKQALSEQIGASPATIRKYLDELENDGKIRPTNKTRSGYAVVEAYRAN